MKTMKTMKIITFFLILTMILISKKSSKVESLQVRTIKEIDTA